MVIRSSFVTNSSSSSFVVVDIDSKEIADILREFEEELEDIFEFGGLNFNSDTNVSMFIDEGYADEPQDPEDIVHILAGLFAYGYWDDYCCSEDEDEEFDITQYPEIVQRLVERKDEIMANLKNFRLTNGHSGWQGDDDTRFEEDWYDEETLIDIKETIAEEKGYSSVDEVTDEDFGEYVCDKVNTEECVYEYNGETKESKSYRTTCIE